MNISNNVSKTAFLTCVARSIDNDSLKPILGDNYAKLFVANSLGEKMKKDFGENRMSNYSICARHRIIDDFISETAKKHKTLVINIGCGLDTRPFRMAKNVSFWLEIDTKDIIDFKNQILPENHAEVKTKLKRATIDFEKDSLSETIKRAISNETFEEVIVIFEGIFMYLSLEIIQNNMNELRKIFDDFVVVFDFYSERFHNFRGKKLEKKIKTELNTKFTFMPKTISGFLHDIQLKQISYYSVFRSVMNLKFSFLPLKILFCVLPKVVDEYAIVCARNNKS